VRARPKGGKAPDGAVERLPELPSLNQSGAQGLWLTIRGRGVALPGLKQPRAPPLRWLAILGPGLVAAMAGDDAGGIATYSSVGAKFGYQLLWMLLLITLSLAVVQEMCGRLGAATGRGMLDLVRERFGIGWALLVVGVVLLANGGVIVSEFVGIGAAVELFGISRYIVVPLAAASIWYLVIAGSQARVEKVFIGMTVVFLAYPLAAFLGQPDWGEVARGAFVPSLQNDPEYLMLFVATVGTTITPYMQLFQQSSIVEKGVARRHYGPERVDAYVGAILSNLVAAFIIIATAAALHSKGVTEIETAADAALALKPAVGDAAQAVFAIGLFGASLFAAGVLPVATSYSVSEAFGFRKGVDLDLRRAPVFLSLFTALVVICATIALIPGVPVIRLLVGIQVLNGMLLPVILFFLLVLVNDERLAGEQRNSRLYNILGWGTFAFVSAAVAAMLVTQAVGEG
jgi:NRAMP (natural resistance-associated macrophage protein)-like metal ion transporter